MHLDENKVKIGSSLETIFGKKPSLSHKPNGDLKEIKTVVNEPLQRNQIIELGKLAESIQVGAALKRSGKGVSVAFF